MTAEFAYRAAAAGGQRRPQSADGFFTCSQVGLGKIPNNEMMKLTQR